MSATNRRGEWLRRPQRTEREIFVDLETLCRSPGYIHALAAVCHRDNTIVASDELCGDDLQHIYSVDRLIRSEISMLTGLLLKADIDYEIPAPSALQSYIERTDALLQELHKLLSFEGFVKADANVDVGVISADSLGSGKAFREAFFYAAESAYSFQYRDLSVHKYSRDEDWLRANRGFSIKIARDVVHSLASLWEDNAGRVIDDLASVPLEQRTLLRLYEFSSRELSKYARIDESQIVQVLSAFTVPGGEKNAGFSSLNDFNVANALPIIRRGDTFILLQRYSLEEALYDAPFYWMCGDKQYFETAMHNRGLFAEEFAANRFSRVFGEKNVHKNVNIVESKARKIGEIDVLVVFGNRAVVIQAKSKRLTLEARRGSDGQIRGDFKRSVLDAHNQGLLCARHVLSRRHKCVASQTGVEIVLPDIKEVYVLCVVSDHYPALASQVRQFLKVDTGVSGIAPTFVCDVFALDVMTEMLDSPLRLLSYIDRRSKYSETLFASHERVILSYHLHHNLWLDGAYDLVIMHDSMSEYVDVPMTVRRDGVPGRSTPEGIWERTRNTTIGRFISQIESTANVAMLDLGFMLLKLGENSVLGLSRAINDTIARARADGRNHDVTFGFSTINTGITIHCNDDQLEESLPRLSALCLLRKYTQRANTWHGVCVSPSESPTIRFVVSMDFQWMLDRQMEDATRNIPKADGAKVMLNTRRKQGRNEPCICGSGRKYKKCCGRTD